MSAGAGGGGGPASPHDAPRAAADLAHHAHQVIRHAHQQGLGLDQLKELYAAKRRRENHCYSDVVSEESGGTTAAECRNAVPSTTAVPGYSWWWWHSTAAVTPPKAMRNYLGWWYTDAVPPCYSWPWWLTATVPSLVVALVITALVTLVCSDKFLHELMSEFRTSRCVVRNNYIVMEAVRPITNCSYLCGGGGGISCAVELSANVSQLQFSQWAYRSRPTVVRGAAAHWKAMQYFSVPFFKTVYDSVAGAYDDVAGDCQFLPFKSEFLTLKEALAIHPARAARQPGTKPWYFGWSNCSPGVSAVLRQLAPGPSFLPKGAELSALDWIFMGGSGNGAAWHLDYVQRPSWQAQISGTKTWHFRPVVECQKECQPFSVTVYKGDIIFVDTNQWYHMTYIHPNDQLSITIGSEYD
ncbi:unnamed protein product [Meganyctiphanes norvegica]|uniref:Cupin-like domain-containing protein n=1 Tax=Meganyctiphanes norvegica TaxID=48144 RepID=A0AAV2RXM2_MEGNR